jgi:hypothetical protein
MIKFHVNEELVKRYMPLKEQGLSVQELFQQARLDGNKHFDCILMIVVLYKLDLGEARDIGNDYYESNAWLNSPEKAEWDKKNSRK